IALSNALFFSIKKQSTTRNDSLLFLRLVLNTFLFALLPKQGIVMNLKKKCFASGFVCLFFSCRMPVQCG
ncbi:hypothetical protein RPJ45_24650, partial [Salmonella enterica]|uniref:hypothetical protein n=1 Tax=Salmonella enterica TaxID=28901 RepID=UPI002AFDCB1B